MNISEIKDDNERLNAYETFGYTKEALKDEDWMIRFNTYETLSYTKEAMQDEDWMIRLNAYEKLGFTKEAMQDENPEIRTEQKGILKTKSNITIIMRTYRVYLL